MSDVPPRPSPPRSLPDLVVLSLVILASALPGQDPGVDREKMWPAPTAEDWKRPCLIQWQRTWGDAVALSKETKRPILICVNMDGEIASEHYAGIRYRQPEIAALYEPYVTVIASVYRHTPRDYDEQGRRIPCPRFGTVTCGEHIAIEPILYEKFFEGERVAPRHIMVELDGEETYDVYYTWDTASVFRAVREGITKREVKPEPIVRGDRSILERVASRHSVDREAVEKAYVQGDEELRRSLLEAAKECGAEAPVDLLRLAVFGLDAGLSRRAQQALTQARSEKAVGLISEALRIPMESERREALITALEAIGESSPRARTLAVVHRGLGRRSRTVDIEGWSQALRGGGTYGPPVDDVVIASRLDKQNQVYASKDAGAHVDLAEAFLKKGLEYLSSQRLSRKFAEALFVDARDAALEARRLGAEGWRVNSILAVAAYYVGEREEARTRAEEAVGGMPPDPQSWSSMVVLGLFAEARRQAIEDAVSRKQKWPGQWLADVNAAYSVLAEHPYGDASQVLAHHDFLVRLGARAKAAKVLDAGLERFPDAWDLHDRLRTRILRERGVEGLEAAYAERLQREDAPRNLEWFAGYASLVAAEYHRRAGDDAKALAAYERGIEHYERGIENNAGTKPTADHYIALALAGRARVAFEAGDLERAVEHVVASFERKPGAAASPDGFNIRPVDTAKMLLSRLEEQKHEELAKRLQAALDRLDPRLLQLPSYERRVRGRGPAGGRGRRRR